MLWILERFKRDDRVRILPLILWWFLRGISIGGLLGKFANSVFKDLCNLRSR